jgi:hypothetical protein
MQICRRSVCLQRVGEAMISAAGWLEGSGFDDAGELFTFGLGNCGRLGHGGDQNELVPRLVETMAGKKVIGAATALQRTEAYGLMQGSSSPLGMETVDSWSTEGQRMSLCLGWSRRRQGKR